MQNCTRIGTNAFSNCISLTSIGDTSNITYIGSYSTFENTSSLAINLNFPALTQLLGTFTNSGITGITNLGSITLLDSTFHNCRSLLTAIMPATLTTLTSQVFNGCSALRWIKFLATTPPTIDAPDYVFLGTTCKFYVPDDSVASYKSNSGWSSFSSRIFSLTQFAIDFPNG